MDDTPQHIKDLQLQIWLSKPPMERLRQFLVDNEALYQFWDSNKAAENTQPTPGKANKETGENR
jgi:hypothetical protein